MHTGLTGFRLQCFHVLRTSGSGGGAISGSLGIQELGVTCIRASSTLIFSWLFVEVSGHVPGYDTLGLQLPK